MQFIDSHAHINSAVFKNNWQEIVQDAVDSGVTTIINNAADLPSTEWGIKQAEQSQHLYATAGIHPEFFLESDQAVTASDYDNLRTLVKSSAKVVAIGEIGLDYTLDLDRASKQKQFSLIESQLQLAIDLNLPVTLHVRDIPGRTDCFKDLISILKNFQHSRPLRGVFHCWVGTPAQAEQALDLGLFLSFSGILTYKSAGHILEVAASTPLDRILIETDAPYLTPEPARSQIKPSGNQPQYVIMTAEKLAEIRNVLLSTISESTVKNTRQLFGLA